MLRSKIVNNFDVYIQDKNNVSRHILLLLLSAFLITFGVWAYFSPLDITSEALGVVVPSKNIQKIQHLEGGIIESVDVREGDIVSKGQALLSLEGTASISDLEQLRVRMASLRADLVRLEGELNDTDQLKFEKDLEEDHLVIIESAKEIFSPNSCLVSDT
ncbi:MAG TPA: biotin/lipoyl-binding protein [Alphaproteobacteria bacterium]|nr:biotin/lipoyl-binding protein [Alphaproteobacteria bacterium]